ncbi:MAG TPA: DUF4296 domain-containing protein [Puia sp.]|nr:DUF4296 domain-containing protein [Puia sp.]
MRVIAGLLCIVLIVGCSEKDSIPSGVLGKEEMGSILWDMMQADQYASSYLIKDTAKVNLKMETLKLYEEVFRLHKTTREEFRKSFQFYQDHPDITRVLFDSLIARGNRMRSESYTHSSAPVPSVPAVKPAVTGPVGKPPGTLPNRPAGALSNRPPGVQSSQPGGIRLPNGVLSVKDSMRWHRKGIPFLPGQHSGTPGAARPFQGKDTTKH